MLLASCTIHVTITTSSRSHLWTACELVLDNLALPEALERGVALDGGPVHEDIDIADLVGRVVPDEAEACKRGGRREGEIEGTEVGRCVLRSYKGVFGR